VDGDIVIHPGAFVSGDVLAVGGHVHDEGGEVTEKSARSGRSAPMPRPVAGRAVDPPVARTFPTSPGWSGCS
jgi:hypothetical protein